jgi:hypothetical protein
VRTWLVILGAFASAAKRDLVMSSDQNQPVL